MPVCIYTLKLTQGKYYVGSTNNIDLRYAQHLNGTGAEYTRRYYPIQILNKEFVSESLAGFREDLQVKRMMGKHGIDNVRGGSYSQIELPVDSIKALTRELNHAAGACLRCGSMDHWVSKCDWTKPKPVVLETDFWYIPEIPGCIMMEPFFRCTSRGK